MKHWWKRWQNKRVPKIHLGSKVKVMHGDTPIGYMVLVEFTSTYSGGQEARLVDLATYEQRHKIH